MHLRVLAVSQIPFPASLLGVVLGRSFELAAAADNLSAWGSSRGAMD